MPGQCEKCSVLFSSDDVVVKCVECKLSFHNTCTKSRSAAKNKNWKCESCKDDSASVKSNDECGEDKRSIFDALKALKNDINSNINEKIKTVTTSIESLRVEIRELGDKFSVLEANQIKLEERCDILEREKRELQDEIHNLNYRIHETEQHSRSSNIQIIGVPATKGEDVYVVLSKIAEIINVPYRREDISLAHRIRVFSKKLNHAPIIAQFVSRSTRELWIAAAKKKKGFNATDIATSLQDSRVYVNEHLTRHNQALLGRARGLQRAKKIYFAGYSNGKVLVRPREGDAAIRVYTLEDLDKFQ